MGPGMSRFMYWAPWTVTRPWLPRVGRGCDEWHNKSVLLILPFLGAFIFFWERDFNRDGEEHLYAWCLSCGWEGAYHIDCDICNEIRVDHEIRVNEKVM